MVQLVLRLTAAPGRVEDTLRALSSIRVSARLDSGCLSTYAGADGDEPDICLYMEDWADRDLLARRIQSATFRALLMLMETSVATPSLEIREASGLGGLDYVARARGEQHEDAVGGSRAAIVGTQHTK